MSDPNRGTVVLTSEAESSLRSIGHISYALHAIVAVGAVLPGAQGSVLLLLVAFILDLVKRGDAQGSWQESHFRWRIRSVVFAAIAYAVTARLAGAERPQGHAGLILQPLLNPPACHPIRIASSAA